MIHSLLKQSTRELHHAVEEKLQFLLSDKVTFEQYAAVQKQFYGFYQPIEARLALIPGLGDLELAIHNRWKLPLLIRDLHSLAVDAAELAQLPSCVSLPRLETLPEALGCLYVLEGSTLGGKFITGHIKQVLAVDENRGCAFFNSYGNDVGRMWSSFLEVLTSYCREHDAAVADAVVHSACQTFTSLDQWFSNAAQRTNRRSCTGQQCR